MCIHTGFTFSRAFLPQQKIQKIQRWLCALSILPVRKFTRTFFAICTYGFIEHRNFRCCFKIFTLSRYCFIRYSKCFSYLDITFFRSLFELFTYQFTLLSLCQMPPRCAWPKFITPNAGQPATIFFCTAALTIQERLSL